MSPSGSAPTALKRTSAARRAQERALRRLASGTPVLLSARGPAAVHRCRESARRAGIVVEREYLAFPSPQEAAYLVEDARAPVRVFMGNLLVAPPGSAMSAPVEVGLAVVRALMPWWLLRIVAPGRVVVGRRA